MEETAVPLSTLVTRLRAAGEPTRLRILHLLALGELTVSELTLILNQSQPRVSRHLKLLLEAGLIERLPEGAWVFYRLAEAGSSAGAGAFAGSLVGALGRDDVRLAADRLRRDEVTRTRAEAAARYFAANAADWSRVRALYLPEADIETAALELLGPGPIDLLVDLGTGTGRMLEVLAGLYNRAVGFDLSHDMLSVARVNLERSATRHAHVRHGDLFALPLQPGSADAVVLHQVLHYLDSPAAAVAASARLLAPGGKLLIVDFAPHTLEFLRTEHAHRRLGFASDEVRRWIEHAGLEMAAVRELHAPRAPGTPETLTVTLWLGCARVPASRPRTKEAAL